MLDRVLLTNDDGIEAPGLAVLEQIATKLAREIWVVAPEHDQSGVSHAVSLHHPIRLSERGLRRYGITGTPGDCAVMGACHLMPEGPQFRSWYPPGVMRQVNGLLDRLSRRHEVPVIDAHDWIATEDAFLDSHHLLPEGAEVFSRRLGREALPLLLPLPTDRSRAVRIAGRGGD